MCTCSCCVICVTPSDDDEQEGNDRDVESKKNRKNATHTIMFDIQNVSGNQNVFTKYFNEDDLAMETVYQLGMFPFFNYRIEFQIKWIIEDC